jgi:hypothetical protein
MVVVLSDFNFDTPAANNSAGATTDDHGARRILSAQRTRIGELIIRVEANETAGKAID